MSSSASPREAALAAIRGPGVLPALKLKRPLTADEAVILGRAIVGGGCRILEITMTSPGVLDTFRAIRAALGDEIALAAGTTLDASAARDAIDAGAFPDYALDYVKNPGPELFFRSWETGMTESEVFNLIRYVLIRFYFRPSYLLKTLTRIRSFENFVTKSITAARILLRMA